MQVKLYVLDLPILHAGCYESRKAETYNLKWPDYTEWYITIHQAFDQTFHRKDWKGFTATQSRLQWTSNNSHLKDGIKSSNLNVFLIMTSISFPFQPAVKFNCKQFLQTIILNGDSENSIST